MDALVEIKRFENDKDKASRGVVFLDGGFFGFSLERPDKQNQLFVSRINTGEYTARKVHTESRGWFWLLDDANGRTEIILFHSGSTMDKFAGCLGLGAEIGKINGQRAIFETKWMCEQWMKATELFDVMRVIIT